ncbi:hypothetical protein [Thaumasiovibrio subtropicus]|uniref:hypothetical protein n=1 Tax=Thaumasiovibrio subtropicus TaxID=1891207 RepID=UPI000B362A02|nr:hypothetical protein [Thaumasiovibrio subtropicus]
MKLSIQVLLVVLSILMSGVVKATSIDDEFYRQKMINNMKSAGDWVIQEGIKTYREGGKEALWRKLADTWAVLSWTGPWIETDNYLAQFRIKARGINYQIHNLYREEVGGVYYEFWLIKVLAKDWSGERPRSVFYVAKANDTNGEREILVESDQFIGSYTVAGNTIHIPIDNKRLLYILQAWDYPDAYRETNLAEKIVVMDRFGNIEYAEKIE